MKPQSKITQRSRVAFVALSAVALAIGSGAFRAQADEWDKRTIISIDQPMQVRETLLEPGQYVFKLLDSNSDRHIVQIYNAGQTHLINTMLAIPNYRLQPTGGSRFLMWETPEGSVKALRAWFYPGDNFGQEFPYPKHLQQIVAQTRTESFTPASPPQAEPAPAAEEQSQIVEQQEQTVVAQNTPPPPPPAAVEQPEQPSVSPTPAVLPKTASPYPLIGFTGLLLLGLGGLVRQIRSIA